jgi:GNAT superfamily N-acetyltransferase
VERVSEMEISVADAGSAEAQWAMTQYFDELAVRIPGGFDATGVLDGAALTYNPPAGVFILASVEGEVVGCGALQHLDDDTAEVKRMWVSPSVRGRGLAKRLLARLELESLASGRNTIVLDTNASLTEAITMYGKQGYAAAERYNDNPYAQLWFRKELEA